jgi:acyl-CoA synthetase (AMP-forming)/AMP-acid ligase II
MIGRGMLRLHDFLDYWARATPAAEFAAGLTYRDAAAAANRLAARLAALGPGTRVAVLARNSARYAVLYFAAAKAGAVLVPLNWRLAPQEWAGIVADARPAVLIADAEFAAAVGELAPAARLVGPERRGWESLERWLSEGPAGPPDVDVDAGSPLYQMYTSGTTGAPKGAVLSHAAVTANVTQVALAHPVLPGERGLVVTPMFHAAIIPSAFAVVCRGGALVIHDAFDPERTVRALADERIAVTTLVPAMLAACLAVAGRRFPALRSIYYGASPIAEETLRRSLAAFGCGFVQSYGMTEAAQALTFLSPEDHRLALAAEPELLLSAGRPAAGTDLRIAELGEILARGPQLMSGYWERTRATDETLRDGWLHTGDAGRLDARGYLFVEDRIKDLIVSGGENVYPRIVEDALHGHPAIAEAAVIGVPDERWGETVKAVVTLRPGAECSADELLAFCRPRLGTFERPRSVDFVAELPRTATGKVLKRVLREPYWQGRSRRVSGA